MQKNPFVEFFKQNSSTAAQVNNQIPAQNGFISGLFEKKAFCSVEEITKHFVQENIIIWHDPKVNQPENAKYAESLQTICDLKVFSDSEEVSYFLKYWDKSCTIITSGTNGELLTERVGNFSQVDSIYVFCGTVSFHEEWAKKYPKVVAVSNDFKVILEKLSQQILTRQRQSSSLRVDLPSFAPITDYDKSEIKLYLTELFKSGSKAQGKSDFLKLAKAINQTQDKKDIKAFDQNYTGYDMKTILNWYTKESFFYKVLNNCLRIATLDSVHYCRFVLRHLEAAIKEQYMKKSKEFNGLLYGAAYIGPVEWNNLQANCGKDIEMYGFLSTSKQKAQALNSLNPSKTFITIIVPGFSDGQGQGFAEMAEFSAFASEDEVLFNIQSRFTVIETKSEAMYGEKKHLVLLFGTQNVSQYLRSKKPAIEVKMRNIEQLRCCSCNKSSLVDLRPDEVFFVNLANSDDKICHECIQNKVYNKLTVLACVSRSMVLRLIEMPEEQRTIKIEGLLTKYTADSVVPFYGYSCKNCGATTIERCYACQICKTDEKRWCDGCFGRENPMCLDHLITVETQPYTFWSEKTANSSDADITYHNLGLSSADMKDFKSAIKYHSQALEIRKKTYGKDHPITATSHFELGMMYINLEDFAKALECHQEALRIRKLKYGDNHPDTQSSLEIIKLFK